MYAEIAKIHSKKKSCIYKIVKKKKKSSASFAVTLQNAKIVAKVCDKCLVKMEKALNLWVEDMNRKHILIDPNMLCQKALNLYEDFRKGSPEVSNTKPFTLSKGWLHRFRDSFRLRNRKLLERPSLLLKKVLSHFRPS
uniref:HTH CENPB-type domain-containing protein n=1 Tax=Rousettus aegyptiacus TaxID=9407 RepID=A0A7J8HSQ2_ROUAE|nr:hypothetical protein HJG63_010911 [Rousettus aegyptiacus]